MQDQITDVIIWKPVVGFEGAYEVSSAGDIKSVARTIEQLHWCGSLMRMPIKEKILSQCVSTRGYLRVTVGGKKIAVHRIMAEAFLKKMDGYDQVNHKNGIKTDNALHNLEWSNNSENQKHRYRVLGHKSGLLGKTGSKNANSKPCVAISMKDGTFHNFDCAEEAVRRGFARWSAAVSKACLGRRPAHSQFNGHVWSYL